ncbi:TonB-dependent receptor plug domain-containing protein, partial [Akkermansiaceae bacterium]|nr:TonB-dependent receptor plug domain-containing protein [Akkermansiaceae bacterium]
MKSTSTLNQFVKAAAMPLTFGLTIIAHAQEAPVSLEEDESVLTVVAGTFKEDKISAFKTGTPLIEIPRSVSVFSEEQIKEQAITSIAEIVDYTPGVINTQGE